MMTKQIIETAVLTMDNIVAIAERRAIAVRVPNYFPAKDCDEIVGQILKSELYGEYENAPGIGRVGQSYFEGNAGAEAKERYREKALKWHSDLRKAAGSFRLPINQLRLELDERWLPGACLLEIGGRKAFAGLFRIFGDGNGTEVHQDRIDWDMADIDGIAEGSVFCQLAANIYLQTPGNGGEVSLWPFSLSRSEYEHLRNKGSYGVCEDKLPDPTAVYRPEKGDLWLFRATDLHRVNSVLDAEIPRVTQSAFIGYSGRDQVLRVWS